MTNLVDNWTLDRAPGGGKVVFANPGTASSAAFVGGIVGLGVPSTLASVPATYAALPPAGSVIPPPGSSSRSSYFLAFKEAVGFDAETSLTGMPVAALGKSFSLSTWINAGVTTVAGWNPDVTLGALWASNPENDPNPPFSAISFWPGGGNGVPPSTVGLTYGDINEGVEVSYPSDHTTNAGWLHLMYSAMLVSVVDDGTGNITAKYNYIIYSNDTQIANVTKSVQPSLLSVGELIDFSTSASIGGDVGGLNNPPLGNGLKVALTEFWATNKFIDWSNSANRYKFHVTDGNGDFQTWAPCSVGSAGTLPGFGTPLVYLSGGSSLFPNNRARGGVRLTVNAGGLGLFDVDDPPT